MRFGKHIAVLILLCFCFALSSCQKSNTDEASAYDKAVSMGYEGTSEEFLAALAGENVAGEESAYEIACENGFSGTYEEWLSLLNINIEN